MRQQEGHPMRIAQLSPLFESVPPKLYGGTERIVHYLAEELVRQGHEVTLFASGDSSTSAKLVPCGNQALRLANAAEPLALHLWMLEKAFQRRDEFDIIHSHLEYLPFPLARRHPDAAVVTTLHGRLDLPELQPLFREYTDAPLVSISDSQREPVSWANWQGTVLHGLPPSQYRFHPEPGRYLAFLGRVSPEKRPDLAMAIAIRSGIPLKMAAKVDRQDRDYFEARIRPFLSHPLVEFVGEIGEDRKEEFLGGALALLFPIDWPEPFGLVMIESMACGTPVIAMRRGSVPEVMRQGVSGFMVRNEDEAVAAVEKAAGLDRAACRAYFESLFTAERMAGDYLDIYRKVTDAAKAPLDAVEALQEEGRPHGGGHNGREQPLHHGQLLPGRNAEKGP
jgi:glycosyltransferase involved in cell wall biosynthesis